MIVGGSLEEQIPKNLFLSSVREYRNFNLKFKIRLVEGKGFMNSGVQIRSSRLTGESAMTGYQVDAGIGYWGDLYDEHRREQKLIGPRDPDSREYESHVDNRLPHHTGLRYACGFEPDRAGLDEGFQQMNR